MIKFFILKICSRNLRRKGIIDYKENNNIATTSQSPSTTTSRKRKYNCFCGKDNNNKLTYCYGPSCPWGWVHIKCLGLQDEPRRAFCSEKCKNDEVALMADENAVFQNYDWCSCRKVCIYLLYS
uniref:Uncharacterized protein n=1 Tax=Panagrolaimus superbus TaxID=310955 RepID=A0A914YB83_9BILA